MQRCEGACSDHSVLITKAEPKPSPLCAALDPVPTLPSPEPRPCAGLWSAFSWAGQGFPPLPFPLPRFPAGPSQPPPSCFPAGNCFHLAPTPLEMRLLAAHMASRPPSATTGDTWGMGGAPPRSEHKEPSQGGHFGVWNPPILHRFAWLSLAAHSGLAQGRRGSPKTRFSIQCSG